MREKSSIAPFVSSLDAVPHLIPWIGGAAPAEEEARAVWEAITQRRLATDREVAAYVADLLLRRRPRRRGRRIRHRVLPETLRPACLEHRHPSRRHPGPDRGPRAVDPLTFVAAVFATSLVAGGIGAMLGLGGGILLVPILTMFFGVNLH